MEDFTQDPDFIIYGQHMNRDPDTLQELSQLTYQKQIFMTNKKEFFNKTKAENENGIAQVPLSQKVKKFFLFHSDTPYIFIHRQFSRHSMAYPMYNICSKAKEDQNTSISNSLASNQGYRSCSSPKFQQLHCQQSRMLQAVLRYPNVLEKFIGMDIPPNQDTKLICHDPWVSFVVTAISIIGVIAYLYQTCKNLTILKGHKFASVCHISLDIL